MTEKKLSIDVGAKAELSAKAEIKATVPEKSAGRFVDALTDLIRPLSEARGLKADQIRLQREEVLIEVAKRARERLAIENASIEPLPNKFMIPLLEAASYEEVESPLVDMWANLLASAASRKVQPSPRFISVLKELTSPEVDILNRIVRNNVAPEVEDKVIYNEAFDRLLLVNTATLNDDVKEIAESSEADEIESRIMGLGEFCGVCLVHASFTRVKHEEEEWYEIQAAIYRDDLLVHFDILQSLNLIERFDTGWVEGANWSVVASGYKMTSFGLELWRACNGKVLNWRDQLDQDGITKDN